MARRKTKRLLSEGEMRRFAKLAKISPVNEMYGTMPGARDGEDEEEGAGMRDMQEAAHEDEEEPAMRDMQEAAHEDVEEMEVSADEMDDMDMDDMDDMDDEMDMGMGMDMPAADEDEGMVDIEVFMGVLEDALEQATGKKVSAIYDDDEEAPDEGGDDNDKIDMGMSPKPEPEDMPDMDELAEAIARRVRRRMNENRRPAKRTRSNAETVNAVTERVMKRINEEKKQAESLDKRADALTDRIFARLMKESR